MMAIIDVARQGSAVRAARQQLTAAGQGRSTDYRLSFESIGSLFAEVTPARLDLLDTLRKVGPCSVYALANSQERSYSEVHINVSRLEELGLIERSAENAISVPFASVKIYLPLGQIA